MEFSCHTWAFNDLTLPEALGTIARLGFRYADVGTGPHVNHARAIRDPKDAAAEILEDLEAFNLKLGDLCLMLPRISVNNESKRTADIEAFKGLLPFAKAIGAPGITLSPGLVHPAEDVEAIDRTVMALREIVKAAEKASMPVSIEPHMDSMAQKPGEALKLVKEVAGLKLTVDWAHLVCADARHDEIEALLPHARHIQMRQAARAQLQLPFDRGRIEPVKVVEALRAAKYAGVVGIEYLHQAKKWHGAEEVNAIREVTRVRDELRKARDKAQAAEAEAAGEAEDAG